MGTEKDRASWAVGWCNSGIGAEAVNMDEPQKSSRARLKDVTSVVKVGPPEVTAILRFSLLNLAASWLWRI